MPIRLKNTDTVFFPVPKCASTSIKAALLKEAQPELFTVSSDGTEQRPNVHLHFPEARELRFSDRFRYRGEWLCIVRHPFERFMSGFRDRVNKTRDLAKDGVTGLPLQPSVEEFAENIAAYMVASQSIRHHFQPMTYFIGRKPSRFRHIYNMGQLAELIELLGNRGLDLKLRHDRRSSGPSPLLSSQTQTKLEDIYKDDFRYWSRYFS